MTHADGDAVVRLLSDIVAERRGFAAEGAAMGLALLDILSPWGGGRFARFVAGPARDYV